MTRRRSLQRQVLSVLASSKTGLTHQQLVAALRPNQRLSFDEEVERNATISRALHALKSEHRAWPTTKAGLQQWNITPRGRKS
jgi:hypothetical protein